MIKHNWGSFDFNSAKMLALAKEFGPSYLRVGGTDADYMVFTRNNNARHKRFILGPSTSGHPNFYIMASDWDKLNHFVQTVGWDLIYDLNIAPRKNGKWDPTNTIDLLKYTAEKGYKVYGLELGNEINISPQFHVSAAQSGQDFLALKRLLPTIHGLHIPKIFGPDVTNLDVVSFTESFLAHGGREAVDVVTFHHYYMGGSHASVLEYRSAHVLDSLKHKVDTAINTCKKYAPGKPVWLAETSVAWSSAPDNLNNQYVASFAWLDKLGISAQRGIKAVLRQTFYGGLISKSLDPNNDYWITCLYKRLVGDGVLSVSFGGDSHLRAYAHCTRVPSSHGYHKGSVTIILMNIGLNTMPVEIKGGHTQHLYMFSPGDSHGLKSESIKLNGHVLKIDSHNKFPNMPPVSHTGTVQVGPAAIGFIVLTDANHSACR
ncbi:hypothetical protein SNE40_017702 [Patella caerulea]